MMKQALRCVFGATAILAVSLATGQGKAKPEWQEEFGISSCTLQTTGRNEYFILEPGHQLVLEGGGVKLHRTVLNETHTVDGVLTRVVEEREWKDGQLYEVARNYFAICDQTKDVFYFGEDVAFYENGKVTKTDGSWLAGKGNRPGLMRSEEHTSELQSRSDLVCRLLLEKKKTPFRHLRWVERFSHRRLRRESVRSK